MNRLVCCGFNNGDKLDVHPGGGSSITAVMTVLLTIYVCHPQLLQCKHDVRMHRCVWKRYSVASPVLLSPCGLNTPDSSCSLSSGCSAELALEWPSDSGRLLMDARLRLMLSRLMLSRTFDAAAVARSAVLTSSSLRHRTALYRYQYNTVSTRVGNAWATCKPKFCRRQHTAEDHGFAGDSTHHSRHHAPTRSRRTLSRCLVGTPAALWRWLHCGCTRSRGMRICTTHTPTTSVPHTHTSHPACHDSQCCSEDEPDRVDGHHEGIELSTTQRENDAPVSTRTTRCRRPTT